MVDTARVLLIDDDDDDRLIIRDLLGDVSSTNYELTWVRSGREGIAALLANEHDVCLLDYRLGELTGIDVLEAVVGSGPTPPCILLTGVEDAHADRAANRAGAVDYLVKGHLTEADLDRALRYAVVNAAAMRSLAESEQRFRSVFAAASEGIVLIDERGWIIQANAAAHGMFDAAPGRLDDIDFRKLLSQADVRTLRGRFQRVVRDGEAKTELIRAHGVRSDGVTFPMEFSVNASTATDRRFWSVIIRDISDQLELVGQLEHEAFHDRLTGLTNRAAMRRSLARATSALEQGDAPSALLLLDLDDFKRVNDVNGHEAGDEVLRLVARRLGTVVRGTEEVARIGGDEFAVLLRGADDRSAIRIVGERMLESLAEPFALGSHAIELSGSIGVALADQVDLDPDEVIRNAEMAMYAVKDTGKRRLDFFDEDLHGRVLEQIALEDDLRLAVHSEQIVLHYQPVIELTTGHVAGFEALARWNHRHRGFVATDDFICAAERSGMIIPLGRLVLRSAIEQAAHWHRVWPGESVSMAVNLSSEQLNDDGLVAFVADLLRANELPPGLLTLEVTESIMVGDVARAIDMLGRLHALGVVLAMDDFGTGYSSLSYLRSLPVDVLKLDRSFVQDVDDSRSRSLVKAVADMSRALGLSTVAEGVETLEQQTMVLEAGYDRCQGFFFSRPLPAHEAEEYLRTRLSTDERVDV